MRTGQSALNVQDDAYLSFGQALPLRVRENARKVTGGCASQPPHVCRHAARWWFNLHNARVRRTYGAHDVGVLHVKELLLCAAQLHVQLLEGRAEVLFRVQTFYRGSRT